MGMYRVNFFFNQFQQGWVETYFRAAPDLSTASHFAQLLSPFLSAPRHVDTLLLGYRCVQVDAVVGHVSLRKSWLLKGDRGTANQLSPTAPEDLASTAAFCRAQFTDFSTKPYLIRGLADDDVLRDDQAGGPRPAPALRIALRNLGDQLMTDSWSGLRQDQTQPWTNVSKVGTSATEGRTQIVGPSAVGFPIGTVVHFKGVPRVALPWLTGRWKTVDGDVTSISIAYPYPAFSSTQPTNMYAQKVAFLYPVFTGMEFVDFRSRKTGRPIDLTRGRSKGIPFRRSLHVVGS